MRGTGDRGSFNASAMVGSADDFHAARRRTITLSVSASWMIRPRVARAGSGLFTETAEAASCRSPRSRAPRRASLATVTETWELMPAKAGGHVLYRVDDKKLLRRAGSGSGRNGKRSDRDKRLRRGRDDGGRRWIRARPLVVYTPRSRRFTARPPLKAWSKMRSRWPIRPTEQQHRITLNLVGLQRLHTPRPHMLTSLYDVQGTTDGKMDSFNKLRDTLGADVVSLITEDADSCGIACRCAAKAAASQVVRLTS